jgi:tetratricopeptide (TPR) repeat protein
MKRLITFAALAVALVAPGGQSPAEATGHADDALRFLDEAVALQRESRHPRGLSSSLIAIGRVHEGAGRTQEARGAFSEAVQIGRALGLAGPLVLGLVHLAGLTGGDYTQAKETLAAHNERLGHAERVEAHFLLWKATQQRAHLEEAHRLLLNLRDATPKAHRDTLFTAVPLRRDILAAWKDTRATQG